MWPDAGLKKLPNFFQKLTKYLISMAFFKLIDLFKNYPKVNNFLGYFWVRICCQELSKIAQSGHTEVDFSFECKNLKTFWLLANAKTWREREKENFQSWLNLAILFATFMVKSSHSLNKYVDRGGGWIRPRLPSYGPGFESRAHQPRFLQSNFVIVIRKGQK